MKSAGLTRPRVFLFLSCLLISPALQSEEPLPQIFLDALDVRLVDVEVVVTDRQGNPVTGLSRDDFIVLEAGKEVEVSHFVEVRGGVLAAAAESSEEQTPMGSALPFKVSTENLHLVVVVDELHLRPDNMSFLLQELRKLLRERLAPGDRVMLVTLGDRIQVEEGFTDDLERLEAALDRIQGKAGTSLVFDSQVGMFLSQLNHASLEDDTAILVAQNLAQDARHLAGQHQRRVERTLVTLRGLTEALAGLGGRKALLFLSDGLASRPAAPLAQAWINKYEQWILDRRPRGLLRFLDEMRLLGHSGEYDARRAISELVEQASSSRVAFYPISVASLRQTAGSAENPGGVTVAGLGPMSRDVLALGHMDREEGLQRFADGTGGVAFTGSAGLGNLLQRIEQDFSHFYSLAYTPGTEDGVRRPLEVRLRDGGGKTVRHTRHVHEQEPLEQLRELTLAALHLNVASNPLEVELVPSDPVRAGRNRYRVPIMIQIPIANLFLLPAEGIHAAQVSIMVAVRDTEDRASSVQQIELPIRIPAEQLAVALRQSAGYAMELEMRGGDQLVSVGILDRLGRVYSAVLVEVSPGEGG